MTSLDMQLLLSEQKYANQEKYWLQKVSGMNFTGYGGVFRSAQTDPYQYGQAEITITGELWEKVLHLGNHSSLSLYFVLLTSLKALIFRYSGNEDSIVAAPVFKQKRTSDTLNDLLILRDVITGDMSFRELLLQIRATALQAVEHQDYPYERILELVRQAEGQAPEEYAIPFVCRLKDLHDEFPVNIARHALTFSFERRGEDELKGTITYNAMRFDAEVIKRYASHFVNTLTYAVSNITAQLNEIPLASQEEWALLDEYNQTESSYVSEKMIHQLFEEQVEKTPNATALVFGEATLTYLQLNERANRLAHKLIASGVTRERIVGIMIPRSMEMIVGMLAILKAGGAYLPIDPEYPSERIDYFLHDSGVNLLLTRPELSKNLHKDVKVIDPFDEHVEQPKHNPACTGSSANLAYVIYTSGSTGQPKGVMIEHRSVVNFFHGMRKSIDFSAGMTILALTTYCFDISVLELLLPLSCGLRVVIADAAQSLKPDLLAERIRQERVDLLQMTPSRMQLLLHSESARTCLSDVVTIMLGGEPVSAALVKQLSALSNARLFNMYGPTETTIWSTVQPLSPDRPVTIGKPIANTQVHVIDTHMNRQPIGVAGELCIVGDGLARGYLHRADLTAERFIANPFRPGQIMYRTGDLVRLLDNGELEHLGRVDDQVKIRGYRIELGEIEHQLIANDSVQEAVVLAKESEEGNKFMCAYLVADQAITPQQIREYLLTKLPEYMIPSYFVKVDAMPLTPNGKINRKQLLTIDHERDLEPNYTEPENQVEQKLVSIWSEVLNIDPKKIGIHNSFFDLGGNSMLFVQMLAMVEIEYPGKILATDLFMNPTIKQIARVIVNQEVTIQANVTLKRNPLPSEFFSHGQHEGEALSYSASLQGRELARLKGVTKNRGVEQEDVLLAAYYYLFSEVMSKADITLYTMLGQTDSLQQFTLIFDEIESIEELVQWVHQRSERAPQQEFPIKAIHDVSQEEDRYSVALLMYKKSLLLANVNLLQHFDIFLEINEHHDRTDVTFEYNGSRMNQMAMQQLVKGYLMIIQLLVDELEKAGTSPEKG
ncbi:amino acid adenylation domain-containing protein [Brevibacillus antibioticus]|uniref:Amino acid adenylation domain-containing protein n=1 Tax=Brevibacillus antibioticus TaxID=2570228 RepID=A0A4U2Y5Q0_9BACL|nr:non-ribosomal peptide synthetase [Brevibacillus antibioticus]TKI55072.1 amino acid adenylation domain-containing protein [Brevibacillus antibioticus]